MKKTTRILSLIAMVTATASLILTLLVYLLSQAFCDAAMEFPLETVLFMPVLLLVAGSLFFTGKAEKHSLPQVISLLLLSLTLVISDLTWVSGLTDLPVDLSESVRGMYFFGWLLSLVSSILCLISAVFRVMLYLSDPRRNPVNLEQKNFWGNIVGGTAILLAGLTGFFDRFEVVQILSVLFALIGLSLWVWQMKVKSDCVDEMAQYNFDKAKAQTLNIIMVIFAGGAITAGILWDSEVSWFRWLMDRVEVITVVESCVFLFLGLNSILTGMIFRKLEAE